MVEVVEKALKWIMRERVTIQDEEVIDVMVKSLVSYYPKCLLCENRIISDYDTECGKGYNMYDKGYGWFCEDYTESGGGEI